MKKLLFLIPSLILCACSYNTGDVLFRYADADDPDSERCLERVTSNRSQQVLFHASFVRFDTPAVQHATTSVIRHDVAEAQYSFQVMTTKLRKEAPTLTINMDGEMITIPLTMEETLYNWCVNVNNCSANPLITYSSALSRSVIDQLMPCPCQIGLPAR